jgi:hypothetical protein
MPYLMSAHLNQGRPKCTNEMLQRLLMLQEMLELPPQELMMATHLRAPTQVKLQLISVSVIGKFCVVSNL